MKLYVNGKFHSMDCSRNVYSALLENNGKIAELGRSEELISKYPEVEIIDLGGKTVIPGIIDTHAHVFGAAYSEAEAPLEIHKSVASLLADLRVRAENTPKGEWIVYKNTYPLRLSELRYPTLNELDAAAPNTPVIVSGYYSSQLNSAALSRIDVGELPKGSEALRDDDGNLTGLLTCASPYLERFMKEEGGSKSDSLCKLMRMYNECGITMAVVGMCGTEDIALANELYESSRQTIRMRYTLPAVEQVAKDALAIEMPNSEFSRVAFLKNFLDGGFLTGTAFMEYPYKNLKRVFSIDTRGEDFYGMFLFDREKIADCIELARKYGLQYGAHCVGSAAARRLFDAYIAVNKKNPIKGERHAVIHADFVNADDAKTANDMGIALLFQPAWHYLDAPNVDEVLDERDAKSFMRYKDIQAFDLAAAGSDHMVKHDPFESVNPYNPFIGLYNMVTCRARDGKEYITSERMSRDAALMYYTSHAARICFDEDVLGTLEVGKCADFAVLDRDYFTCPEEEIIDIKSVMTVVDGKRVI